jgi:hypothetical protein
MILDLVMHPQLHKLVMVPRPIYCMCRYIRTGVPPARVSRPSTRAGTLPDGSPQTRTPREVRGPQRVGPEPRGPNLHGPDLRGPDRSNQPPGPDPQGGLGPLCGGQSSADPDPQGGPGSLQPASGPDPQGGPAPPLGGQSSADPDPQGGPGSLQPASGARTPLPPGRGQGPPRVSSSVAAEWPCHVPVAEGPSRAPQPNYRIKCG